MSLAFVLLNKNDDLDRRGNVRGFWCARIPRKKSADHCCLRAGVVDQNCLPAGQCASGLAGRHNRVCDRWNPERFFGGAEREENPQRAADRILNKFRSNNDDALVLMRDCRDTAMKTATRRKGN